MKIANIAGCKRLFSAVAKEENLRKKIVHEIPKMETPSVSIRASNLNSDSNSNLNSTNKLIQLAQSRATKTTHKLSSILRGPVRSNLLISWELIKLVAEEQKLIPELATWPQARRSYIETFESFKSKIRSREFDSSEITWGQVTSAFRVSVEMAAFYYIGEVIGMISSFPFK